MWLRALSRAVCPRRALDHFVVQQAYSVCDGRYGPRVRTSDVVRPEGEPWAFIFVFGSRCLSVTLLLRTGCADCTGA